MGFLLEGFLLGFHGVINQNVVSLFGGFSQDDYDSVVVVTGFRFRWCRLGMIDNVFLRVKEFLG